MMVAIDPGIRGCGVATWFDTGELRDAFYVRNPAKRGHGIAEVQRMAWEVFVTLDRKPTSVVVERMKVYPDGRTPGDPNVSLLPLVGVAYMFAAFCVPAPAYEFEAPRDWKGTIDGIEVTRRVRERLTPEEFTAVRLPASACDACRAHFGAYCERGEKGCGADHVYDAIGIGLKHLGRFERRRVIAR